MIIIIYQKEFFYKNTLSDTHENIALAIDNKYEQYYKFILLKGGSKKRELHCIKRNSEFYKYQNSIKKNLLDHIPLSENAFGFVKDKSYRDFLIPHIQQGNKVRLYLRLDIKNFFNSIKANDIKRVFKYYFKTESSATEELLELFAEIVTLDDSLPQGAITSPGISNIVMRQIDIRIQKYCEKFNIVYTRYADDLLFSCEDFHVHHKFFKKKIMKILSSQHFKVNEGKTISTKNEISLNGFVVGRNVRISRKKLKDINHLLYIIYNNSFQNEKEFLKLLKSSNFKRNDIYFGSKLSVLNYMNGYRSFLINWLPRNRKSDEYKDMKKRIKKIEKSVIKINSLK